MRRLLFPAPCPACLLEELAPGDDLCPACLPRLPQIQAGSGLCPKCCGTMDTVLDCCTHCLACAAPWRHGAVPWRLTGLGRELIYEFKFRQRTHLLKFIAGRMHQAWLTQKLPSPALVTFVPMHPVRAWLRGYNQAQLLALELARLLDLPCRPLLRRRWSAWSSQHSRGRSERLQAKNQLFSLHPEAKNASGAILLVDDILTTGATLAACSAQILSVPGVTSVDILTAARG